MTAAEGTSTSRTVAPGAGAARGPRRRRVDRRRVGLGAAALLTVLGTYVVVSYLPGVNPTIIPPPDAIAGALLEQARSGALLDNTLASLGRVLGGFVMGAGAAVVLGSLLGWFRTIEYVLDPIVESLRPVPPLAYIPLVIIWLGIGETSRLLVITLSAFLVCIVAVSSGMREVPIIYVEAARTLGASPTHVFRTVALPAATPYIFTGLRTALGASWTTLVAAELIAAQSGLGFMLQSGRRFFRTELVLGGILVIGLLAFCMDRGLRRLQRHATRWSEVGR